jgi:16S rRNA (guanine966-N2)-methyltransferase
MRIIAGKFRQRKLLAPKGNATRPTMSQTRESLFHLVESRLDLEEADVLDLFAGTGALGLEALSRGAGAVTFVEIDGPVLKYARRNAEALAVDDACVFLRADAVLYLERYTGPPFDLILADPPYELEALPRLPDLALPHVKAGGLVVIEHDKRLSFDGHPDLNTSRPYGRTHVSVFRREVVDEPAGAA